MALELRAFGLAGLIATLASSAIAQSGQTYGFVFGGAIVDSSQDADGLIGGAPQTVDTDYDSGFQFGLGIGRSLPGLSTDRVGVRAEIELSYGEADAERIRFSGNGPADEVNVGGGLRSTTLFANIYADFETQSAFTPFVGAGLGIGDFRQSLVYGPGVRVTESDTALGAQLVAGVSYEASDSLTLTADARYRAFYGIESNRFAPTGVSTGVLSGDVSALSINFGARFAF